MGVRLSREEAWEMLAASHTGIFTTLRSDGVPVSLPVWFVALHGHVYVGTPAHTKKVARVRRDGRASFLVEAGEAWADLRGVHLTGRARILDDPVRAREVQAALDAKYGAFRTPRTAMPEATRAHYEVERVLVEIEPDERMLTWDNRRIPLSPQEG